MNPKRRTSILPVLSLFLLMDLATDAQAVTYRFKSLDKGSDVPSAAWNFAQRINDRGQMVGYYDDLDSWDTAHGFVYSNGQTIE